VVVGMVEEDEEEGKGGEQRAGAARPRRGLGVLRDSAARQPSGVSGNQQLRSSAAVRCISTDQ
jgi:hypothetical protein